MSASKKRRGRGWLPWRAFDGLSLDWREHVHNIQDMSPREVRYNLLVLLVVALVLVTCVTAYAVPRLSLLIDVVGALLVAMVVLLLTGQWQELRRGLRETGHWPTVDVQLGMIRQYILETLLQTQERRRWRRLRERADREEVDE